MPSFTLSVLDSKFAEFKEAVLKIEPVPLDDEGSPLMSENAWLKALLINFIKGRYNAGRRELHEEQNRPTIDPDIIT